MADKDAKDKPIIVYMGTAGPIDRKLTNAPTLLICGHGSIKSLKNYIGMK